MYRDYVGLGLGGPRKKVPRTSEAAAAAIALLIFIHGAHASSRYRVAAARGVGGVHAPNSQAPAMNPFSINQRRELGLFAGERSERGTATMSCQPVRTDAKWEAFF